MVAQKGKDMLIKIDMTGAEGFQTLAGLRASRLSFNAEPIDVTSLDSTGAWRELLSGEGIRAASVSGSGVFRDENTDERARQIFFSGATSDFQIIIPDFGVIEGPFIMTSLEYSGQVSGEASFDMSLASAGELIFAAV